MKQRQQDDLDLDFDDTEDLEQDEAVDDSNESAEDEVESQIVDSDDNESEDEPEMGESEDELSIEIEGESPTQTEESKQPTPAWVKDVRKQNRELKRQNREFQQKLNSHQVLPPETIDLGVKPTLDACDYDSDKFEQELAKWFERQRKIDEQKASSRKAEEETQKLWDAELSRYSEAKTKIKINDFEDAEEVALDELSTVQQAIIISGAQNPTYVMYALGKNPKKLKELAGISNPIKFACSITRLETQLKITNKKAPAPEKVFSTSASGVKSANSTISRLEAAAERSGDRSKIIEYKRELRAEQRK